MENQSVMFERSEIGGMVLANRFVRSATWEGMAEDDGAVTEKLIRTMVDLAKGGVGLIISGHAHVRPEGQAGPWQLGAYKDELVGGLKKMTAAVHDHGGRIVMQLAHAGAHAATPLTGEAALVVSDFEELGESPRREMTREDIRELVDAFAQGARRAREAGFDGVQIHSAHGYLLSQFLSPRYNRRTDEYGGDIRNRARVHLEVCQAIRKAVGDDYPILMKINGSDYDENGLSLEESVEVGRLLAAAGLDAIEVSGGLLTSSKLSPTRTGINAEAKEAYFREEGAAFKKALPIPVILVGGMRSFEVAERLVQEGGADYISLCRPLIREPGLINRWRSGDLGKSRCISDNLCFRPAIKGEGIYCLTEEREKKKVGE